MRLGRSAYIHAHILVSVHCTAVPVAHYDGEKNTMGSLSFYEFLFFRPLSPASSFAHVDTYGNGIAKKRSKVSPSRLRRAIALAPYRSR